MKRAVSSFGYIIPHIVKVDEARFDEYASHLDNEPYSFLVTSVGPRIDKIYSATIEDAEKKRKKLISEINRYYGEKINV